MVFGVLKDIKEGENRVICTPVEVASIVNAGHTVLVQKGALTVENGAIVGGEIGLMLNGEETTATVSGAVYGYTDTAIFANGGTLTLGDIQLSGSVNYDDYGTFIGGGELYTGSGTYGQPRTQGTCYPRRGAEPCLPRRV